MSSPAVVINAEVRSTGVDNKENPFVMVEMPDGRGGLELVKIKTKSNGQKRGQMLNVPVVHNVYNGKFFGYREV